MRSYEILKRGLECERLIKMNYTEFMNKYKTNYEIVVLRHKGKTFQEIGDHYNLCGSGIAYKYRRFLHSLYRSYCAYLKDHGIKINACEIDDFYIDPAVAIAYIEKEYEELLRLFRNGEPPLLQSFYKKSLLIKT